MTNIIEDAIQFVKNLFENEYSGHDYFHTMRVYKTATKLAQRENANLLTVQLASLLHDVDDVKLSPETSENKDRAVGFLKEHGMPDDEIKNICTIIGEVSFKGTDSIVPLSIEGKCVQDADRLDAIGAIGIARAFAYGGSHHRLMYDPAVKPSLQMNEADYRKSQSTTINRFYEKLFLLKGMMNTASAKRIAGQREAFMRAYVSQFMAEWEGLL